MKIVAILDAQLLFLRVICASRYHRFSKNRKNRIKWNIDDCHNKNLRIAVRIN